jgi:hypothetical protein
MPQARAPKPAALPVPNSSTIPFRLRDATDEQAASFDYFPGQPTNVLVLSADRPDLQNVEIPRGLQNRAYAATDTTTSALGSGLHGLPGGTGTNGSGRAPQGAGSAETNPSASLGRTNPSPTGTSLSANPAGGRRESSSERSVAGEVTRIQHPSNGNFEVVIMQSAVRDDLADLGSMLTGNPVYSVYLRVGDQKEWLLEYCVPARENVQANAYEVNIDDAGVITPPYPISTVIPNSILGQPIAKYIVLHGFLTETGYLRGVKAPDTSNRQILQFLALLGEWRFRPALRNKKPIVIEVLLVVPPRA